ncbi:MAG TPA: tRNA lysidine(34) synthetase TilS [Candidatus Rifleibacterium sp.]|nr:tRNA lysidine(34) synthetase TilS [Candidatus Rifleibacterium sp.]
MQTSLKIDKGTQQSLLAAMIRPPAAAKIAAAVSGGCDSVAMLLLLHQWCRMKKRQLCVFHVDHGLRPSSAEDAAWVRTLSESLGLEFYQRCHGEIVFASDPSEGREAWARDLRYAAFAEMLSESGAEIVATGHSADDQAETIMMRLMRGCSWHGLSGIAHRVRLVFGNNVVRVWRPFLRVSRCCFEKFLRDSGQGWREDETNTTDVFFRNRVRHQLLPLMNQMQPGSVQHLAALGDDARLLQKKIRRRARGYIAENVSDGGLLVYITPDCTLRAEILRLWLYRLGAGKNIKRALLAQLDSLWLNPHSSQKIMYRDFVVFRREGRLVFEKKVSDCRPVRRDLKSASDNEPLSLGVVLRPDETAVLGGWSFLLQRAECLPGLPGEWLPVSERLLANITIRTRRPGDRFYPQGGSGGKKLAKWLIDKKVPVESRDSIPLLVVEGKILLVIGLARSRFMNEYLRPDCGPGWWLNIVQSG